MRVEHTGERGRPLKRILARITDLRSSLPLVPKGASKLSGRYLMPLMLVVPVVVYAYAFQAVVISRSEDHERDAVKQSLDFISLRLSELLKTDARTCRDYAHWDDMYRQVSLPDKKWIDTNVAIGLAQSYGLDTMVFEDRSGGIVWAQGLTDRTRNQLKQQGLLRDCLRNGTVTGLFVMDGRLSVGTAVSVRRSNHTGVPKGMMFVGRRLTQKVLNGLSPGPGHRLVLCEAAPGAKRPAFGPQTPPGILGLLRGNGVLHHRIMEVARDGATYYAALPVRDVNGKPVGALIDISSRASLVRTLQAIKQMSVTLMVLCALIGIAGVNYLRNRELARRANRDELTGLHNHGYLQRFLRNQVHIAERYGRPLSLMMLDIDHFKVFNDSNGHAVGDRVLQYVAEVTLAAVRDTDMVARYGGEEFVVVMPETEPDQASAAAERIRASLDEGRIRSRVLAPRQPDHVDLNVTASIGVASYPQDGKTAAELLASVDVALCAAKRTRDSIMAFGDVIREDVGPMLRGTHLEGFLRDSSISSIRPLVAAIDLRDANMASHSEKTAEYAVAIGRHLGFSTQQLALACKSALLHDVGMIAIPDYLLSKPPPLTHDEVELLKRHVELGMDMLTQSPQLSSVAEIVRCHHERFDGTGYPAGVCGEDIPLISRVVAVADVLDALTSRRPYRPALKLSEAAKELRRESGKQFDPAVVDAALALIERMKLWEDGNRRAA